MKNIYLKYYLICALFTNAIAGYAQNVVSTYCGTGTSGFVNGALNISSFNEPFGLCIDKNNNLYVADGTNNCIRKIDTQTGIVTTLAGTGTAGWKDGPADSAMFNSPSDLCVDDSGNVYVSDFLNHRIRKISVNGFVSTIAGTGIAGFINGSSSIARFNYPRGICIDKNGNLYIGDSWNHRIRKIDTSGNISTYAGGGNNIGVSSVGDYIDASDTSARFYTPAGLAIDQFGNVYVADAYNHRIRKIDTLQIVSTLAGSGATGVGNGGFADGNSLTALLNTPTEVFVDTSNNDLYIGDTFNNRIRKVILDSSLVTTITGNGTAGFNNGVDTQATFNFPRGIVVSNTSGLKIFVCDFNNHSIRMIEQITSGINVSADFKDFSFFPNPVSSLLFIDFDASHEYLIEIYEITGRLIFKKNHKSGMRSSIDCSALTKGIYLLKVTGKSGNSKLKKIVVE